MSDLPTICQDVAASAADIAADVLRRWSSIGELEPWLRIPRAGHDHLPALIASLGAAAECDELVPTVHREPIRLALRHGETRAMDGFDEELIFREYHLLRRALWNHIRERYGTRAGAVTVILRVDSGITVATAASLQGFHRGALEESDQWGDVVERLMQEWPFPDP